MKRSEYNALISEAIDKAVADAPDAMTADQLRTMLQNLSQNLETIYRTHYLEEASGVEEIAESYNVSLRRAQRLAKQYHERHGMGIKANGAYFFNEEEVEAMRPAQKPGPRPRKSK